MMHNGQLADPLNEHAKVLKKLTAKQKKTDADHREISRVEFFGGVYTDKGGRPVIAWSCLEASIKAGAKRTKDGPRAKRSVYVLTSALLQYDGPPTVKELWEMPDRSFVDRRGVKNQQSRIMRTRAIFPKWAADVEVLFDDENASKEDVDVWIIAAGRYEGVGDYRPQHGKFEVELL